MANYQYSSDLVNDILFRAGEPVDGTSDFDATALQYLNRAYQGLWMGGSELVPEVNEVWWWLKANAFGTIILLPLYDYGTISVANGSTSITFSAVPKLAGSNVSLAGRYIKTDDEADVYLISAHTAGATAATLDSMYTGDTDTAAAYKAFALDYDLPSDCLYVPGPVFAYQDNRTEIEYIEEDEMRIKWPLNEVDIGVPQNFTMIGHNEVRFSHAGGEDEDYAGAGICDYIRCDFTYIAKPADLIDSGSQEPVVPHQFRKLLADWALFLLLSDKEDTKARDAFELAARGLIGMAREHRRQSLRMSQSNFGKIYPRQNQLSRWHRPLRTSSGLIITR